MQHIFSFFAFFFMSEPLYIRAAQTRFAVCATSNTSVSTLNLKLLVEQVVLRLCCMGARTVFGVGFGMSGLYEAAVVC